MKRKLSVLVFILLDENVYPATTLQFVDALIKADKDFDMVYYPNRAHSLRSPFAVRKVWDYFVRHLMGIPPLPYQITSWKN